jgi:hypothetical protein
MSNALTIRTRFKNREFIGFSPCGILIQIYPKIVRNDHKKTPPIEYAKNLAYYCGEV